MAALRRWGVRNPLESDDLLAYADSFKECYTFLGVTNVDNLLHVYQGRTPAELKGRPTPPKWQAEASVQQLITFVEMRRAAHRFKALTQGIPFWGTVFSGSILGFALITAAEKPPEPPRVTKPLPVTVIFTDNERRLQDAKIPGCKNKTLEGTAVDGKLTEPEVWLTATAGCPGGRKKITTEIGTVTYKP
ncbi:hypothetical protein [Streptomyces agglomeratus]|uniref:hypothetical protein n=1 Tax=Streptomyces agglomeratus TaxID=285458 RepID=UPI00114CCBBD|nr:hypothetical protein [Streptomyces agglomeratus]